MMAEETRALVLPRLALQVDATEAQEFAGQLMKHAKAGSPMFDRDMTESQAIMMSRLAIAYGLDPLAGEICLYQGRPYVTIGGRTRKALEHPQYDGLECNPATDAERKAFRCEEDEHLWIARVWRKDKRLPFVSYGRSSGRNDTNPVSKKWAQEMASERSRHRALRDAFAMPLPGYAEVSSDRPSEIQSGTPAQIIEGEARIIEAETGEIFDGQAPKPTRSEITTIHTLVGILKWEDDEYRDLLRQTFGVDSSLELTEGQAAALTECLSAVMANAQAEGRAARTSEIVDRMRESATRFRGITDDDDPSWQRTKQRDAERKAALEQAGFEPAAEDRDLEAAANVIDHEPKPTAEPIAEKSRTRIQAEKNYAGLCAAAARLDIDLAPYEIQADCSDQRLTDLTGKLAAAVRVKTEEPKQAATA